MASTSHLQSTRYAGDVVKTDSSYTVYILRTNANTLYVGQTNDLEKRLQEHKDKGKRASKYMRSFDSFTLVYTEKCPTKSDALKRELALKKLSHTQKEALIIGVQ